MVAEVDAEDAELAALDAEVEAADALLAALVADVAAADALEAAADAEVVAEAASTINAHLALSVLVVIGCDPVEV